MAVESVSKIMPICHVADGLLVNGNGDLTFGYSLLLPEVFTLREQEVETLHESFTALLSRLPQGTVVQKHDFFFLDEYKADLSGQDNFTHLYNQKMFQGRPLLRHYSNIYFTVSSKMNFTSKPSENIFFTLKDYLFNPPFENIDEQLETTKKIIQVVDSALNGFPKMKVLRMNDDQLLSALYDFMNLSYDKPVKDAELKTLSPLKVNDDYFKIGNEKCIALSLIREGGELSLVKVPKVAPGNIYNNGNRLSNTINIETTMTYPIGLGLPINHVLCTTIEVLDTKECQDRLTKMRRELAFPMGFGHKESKHKYDAIEQFIEVVTQHNYTPCKVTLTMFLHHADGDKLSGYEALALSAFDNMNQSSVWKESGYEAMGQFMASVPGNGKEQMRGFITTVQRSLCYLPLETHYKSDGRGNLFVDRFGNPILVDLWQGPYILNNRNKVIYGPSGTGKSFLINALIDQAVYNGNHVIVLDVGGSYRKNLALSNGLYFDSKEKSNLQFNIFLCDQDRDGRYLYKGSDEESADDKINFIYSIIAYIWKENEKVSKEQKTILKKIIIAYYEYVNAQDDKKTSLIGFRNFIDVYRKQEEGGSHAKYFDYDSLKLNLDPYTEGEYAYLLNSDKNIRLTDYNYIVFDVEGISKNKELSDIVSLIIIELVMDKMNSLPLDVRKSFIIDEAIDFLKAGDMGDFIAGMYRKIRKRGGEVYLATQSAAFMEEIDPMIMKSIVMNTEVKILLNHSTVKGTYPILKSLLSFTDNDLKILDSLEGRNEDGNVYREFFIKINDVSRAFRYEVSDEAAAVYTTTASELAQIYGLLETTGSMKSAILQYVENKRKLK